MKLKRSDLTYEIVNELIEYFPLTGCFYWKQRAAKWFPNGYRDTEGNAAIWNSLWAGKPALTADNGQGYRTGAMLGVTVKAHRIACLLMNKEWPDQVDHEDGNTSNNIWSNLRCVNNIENGKNQKLHKTNKSGVCGVHWKTEKGGRWVASVTHEGKKMYLGSSKSFDVAVKYRTTADENFLFHKNHGKQRNAA